MNKAVSSALYGALLVGGFSLLGATAANAADTSGEGGILSGTQAGVSVTLPVDLTGNGISVLGDSASSNATTTPVAPAPAAPAPAAAPTTSGSDGLASGLQGIVSVAVPVNVSGNAISVVGDSESTDSAATPAAAPAPATPAATADPCAPGSPPACRGAGPRSAAPDRRDPFPRRAR